MLIPVYYKMAYLDEGTERDACYDIFTAHLRGGRFDWYIPRMYNNLMPAINIKLRDWPEIPEGMSLEKYNHLTDEMINDDFEMFLDDLTNKFRFEIERRNIEVHGRCGCWMVFKVDVPEYLEDLEKFEKIYDWCCERVEEYKKNFRTNAQAWLDEYWEENSEVVKV